MKIEITMPRLNEAMETGILCQYRCHLRQNQHL